MKKSLKYIVVILFLSIILGGISASVFYKKTENMDSEKLIEYISSVKSSLHELDIRDSYSWFLQGYVDGDNIVGEEIIRIYRSSMINIFIKTTVIIFALGIMLMIILKLNNKKFISYLITIVLAIVIIPILSKYEIDIKYSKYYDEIKKYKEELSKIKIDEEEQYNYNTYAWSEPQYKEKIKQTGKSLTIKREDANYIYIDLLVPSVNGYNNWNDVISIKSITSSNGEELDFKLEKQEYSTNEWELTLAVRDNVRYNDEINISIVDKSYYKELSCDIVISINDGDIYQEEENEGEFGTSYIYDYRYFDYYLDEKKNSFDKNIIKDIKIERIPDFQVNSISIEFKNGKSLDTNDGQFPDSQGRYYVNVYLETNFSGDSDDYMTNYALRSYVSEIEKVLNEYGYALWITEIKDLNGNIAYETTFNY